MVRYLTVDELIALNADQEGGVGVQSRDGVEQNAARPQSGFGGYEVFPDLWHKAAAYAHGIASTQYFTDGNKRTGWYAATIFLRLNGIVLRRVPDIEAEAFINAVALDAWKADGDQATVEKAAEWFRTNQRTMQDRLVWAVLASDHYFTEAPGILHLGNVGLAAQAVPALPIDIELSIIFRIRFFPEDVGQSFAPNAAIELGDSDPVAVMTSTEFVGEPAVPAATGHPHHEYGIMPHTHAAKVGLRLLREGSIRLSLSLNGKLLTKLPFTVQLASPASLDSPPAWLPAT